MLKKYFTAIVILLPFFTSAQRTEKVYLNPKDSTKDCFIAVIPEKDTKAFMFLLDGFGASPKSVLQSTDLPFYAAKQGILVIIPILKPGPLYFGADDASQQSLAEQIAFAINKYGLHGKEFYIGGLSLGGTCAVKYAELAVKNNLPVKPKAVFGVDPPLDFQRFYEQASRVVRITPPEEINGEPAYMMSRMEKEMKGTPSTALNNYYEMSPYSLTDTTQRAVKLLRNTPVMLITEPDIQWWLRERGYDYNYMNAPDHAAMINELRKLGNKNAILITTENKGFRQPGNIRHPHSWSIADKEMLVKWLLTGK